MAKRYKLVVYVPQTHGDALREAIGAAGAGVIGKYSYCTFTVKGTTRFKPERGTDPIEGDVGTVEEVTEDRIETVREGAKLKGVLAAIRKVHPYEEPASDVYPIELVE
ncbi:MAG TPA: hypothetical protein VGO43_08180 [Pyrinomonadaceae bacterium]|jgi:hypothetical protein|nr:hypothetical protein [Pyrinomonadaceae bacterium]